MVAQIMARGCEGNTLFIIFNEHFELEQVKLLKPPQVAVPTPGLVDCLQLVSCPFLGCSCLREGPNHILEGN